MQIFRARPAFLLGKTDPCCPETGRTSLPRFRAPQGRAGLADAPISPRPHFRFCRPRVRYASGWIRRPEGLRLSPSLFSLVFRQHSRNMQVAEAFCLPGSETERCGSEDRCVRMSDRPGMPAPVRPVGQPPRRRHPIPLGRRRQSYVSLCGGHTRPGVAISPNRGLRPADCVSDRLPVTRSPPTEGSSCAKAKASETRNPVRQGI